MRTRALGSTPSLPCLVILALAVGADSASAQRVRFAPAETVRSSFDGANSAVAADLNGDGALDLVAVAELDDDLSWFENVEGDGSTWRRHAVAALPMPRHATGFDADGDGDVDLSVSDFRCPSDVFVYLNADGKGHRWTAVSASGSPFGGITSSAVADVDVDGNLDIYSGDPAAGAFIWHDNLDGSGTSWQPYIVALAGFQPEVMGAGDFDGDGDPDGLTMSGPNAKWIENDGPSTTSFWDERAIGLAPGGNPGSAQSGDLDGDGDDDVLVTTTSFSTAREISWFDNIDGGLDVWSRGLLVGAAALSPTHAIARDVDGDLDLDVVATVADFGGTPLPGDVRWYENVAGDGSVWTPHIAGSGLGRAVFVDGADLDGDGDIDLAVADYVGDAILWYENRLSTGLPAGVIGTVGGKPLR